jgi:hypothetical protein
MSWAKAKPTVTAPNQTFDYSQGRDQRWNIRKITSEGACQGLSIFWIIKKANGIDYLTWLGPPKSASSQGHDPAKFGAELDAVVRVMEQQDKIFKVLQGSRELNMNWAKDRIAQAERGGGSTKLKASGKLVLFQKAAPSQISNEVIATDGYAFIGFYGQIGTNGANGGHAVAAYVRQSTVDFFDPNLGEYHFNDLTSFHTWFAYDLMRDFYRVNNLDAGEVQHFA